MPFPIGGPQEPNVYLQPFSRYSAPIGLNVNEPMNEWMNEPTKFIQPTNITIHNTSHGCIRQVGRGRAWPHTKWCTACTPTKSKNRGLPMTATMTTKDITWWNLSNDVVNLAISEKYAVSFTRVHCCGRYSIPCGRHSITPPRRKNICHTGGQKYTMVGCVLSCFVTRTATENWDV